MEYLTNKRIGETTVWIGGTRSIAMTGLYPSEPADAITPRIEIATSIVLAELLLKIERLEHRCQSLQDQIGYMGQGK